MYLLTFLSCLFVCLFVCLFAFINAQWFEVVLWTSCKPFKAAFSTSGAVQGQLGSRGCFSVSMRCKFPVWCCSK